MTDHTITLDELAAATAGEPTHTYRSSDGRYQVWYWQIPGTEEDYSGCRPTARLTVTHDKDRKRYRAELERTDFALLDGGRSGTRESFSLRRQDARLLLRTEDVPRFNAKRFETFRLAALGTLEAWRTGTAAIAD
jgi:hypothetical protein